MTAGSKRVVVAAIIGNGAIMVLKFIASFMSHSSAMLAEAFHSLADTGNQALLLLGFTLSARPADEKHPFGYGKERYFWAFVVAMGIFTVGATFSIYEGVVRIRESHPIQNFYLPFAVLGFAFVFEFFPWKMAVKQFLGMREGRGIIQTFEDARDPALITVLLEDSAALIGVIIASLGIGLTILTGNVLYDGVASIAIGVILTMVAFFLALESRDLLIGESASRRDRAKIRKILHSFPEVERILDLLSMHIGPDEVLLNMNLEFRDGLTTSQIEKLVDDIERAIMEQLPKVKRIFIEADTPPQASPQRRKIGIG